MHREVVAFDEEKAEIAREIGLFGIGLAVGTRREQSDARLRALRRRAQAVAQGAEEGRQALDVHRLVGRGKGARQDEPVLQGVAGAGRRLRAVGEHPPAAVRPTPEIGSVDAQHRPGEACRR